MLLPDKVVVDFETRSRLDVTVVGAWRYAEDASTSILCMSYKIGNGRTGLWTPDLPFPQALIDLINSGVIFFEAHNAQFERAIWINILNKQMGIPMPRRWKDTLAVCAYRALPLGLDQVGDALNLTTKKDPRGKFLIRKLCAPQKITKNNTSEWCDDFDLMQELYDYCVRDTDTEHGLGVTIGDLTDSEQKLWVLDQTINQRGVALDLEAINAAKLICNTIETTLNAELTKMTSGIVTKGSQRARIKQWLLDYAELDMPDMKADSIDIALENKGITPEARRVLQIRQMLSLASIKKLDSLLDWVCRDGRVRGLLQYHGAGTGRWAGRGPQPHNFPRGDEEIITKNARLGMSRLIKIIKTGDIAAMEVLYGDPMNALSTALRGMFVAGSGKVMNVGDFSAIEARVLAWVAGEQWKLDAFAGIDRGEGYGGSQDIYLATASQVFGYPCLTKDTYKKERQVGKTCELAFGYQGGVNAWRKFDKSDKYNDSEVDEKKVAWRKKHPKVVQFWYAIEEAAVACVRTGFRSAYRNIAFEMVKDKSGKWLTCILPNGRRLWYFNPRIEEVHHSWGPKDQITYWGKDSKKGGKWGPIQTYGGMLTENIVQAISRDIMAEAMIRLEIAKYPVILTVHDEIISETDPDFGSADEFEELMCVVPPWVKGCPISVECWREDRYRK